MAKVIEAAERPAFVLAHNKTLAAQLYHEFKSFFPDNAVEYFVSYYDYYQPEAYIPSSDVYIEKDATVNDELDKLRLSATVPVRAARLRDRCQRELHLRPRLARSLLRHAADAREGPEDLAQADCRQAGGDSLRAQRHAISAAAHSACAATSSRSTPLTTTTPSASNCGATKSNSSRRSIRCWAQSSRPISACLSTLRRIT